jgi:hypothetical protein
LVETNHRISWHWGYRREMTNDSSRVPRISALPFDQDSCATVPEGVRAGTCQECRVGRCGKCSNPECDCPHYFAVIGRAIVELDDFVFRASQLLGQLGGSLKTTVAKQGR